MIKMKIGQTTFMGLISLAVFWHLGGETHVQQMGLAGCLFFTCINVLMMNMMGTILIF
jgi:hypothetical protein